MKKLNDGLVYTSDNCIACNRCVESCPVIGANVFSTINGNPRMEVNSDKCIHCGKCIMACKHNAREYRDDTEAFVEAIKNGEKLSVLLAPSFFYLYKGQAAQIIGYMKSLGINKVYDVAFGAEISIWAHMHYLIDHESDPDRAFIGQSCAALTSYFESCEPDLLKYLIPVHSPVICMAKYVRKYLHDDSKLVFISPCITKTDEIRSAVTDNLVQYSVTFRHLEDIMQGVDISDFSGETDVCRKGFGDLFPISGSFEEIIRMMFPRHRTYANFKSIDGVLVGNVKEALKDDKYRPWFLEVNACGNGCVSGPGAVREQGNYSKVFRSYYENRKKDDMDDLETLDYMVNRERFDKYFEALDYNDYVRQFEFRYRQSFHVPEAVYAEIFSQMHKDTEIKQSIDCGSCGYKTCRDMVKAIAYSYSKMENCVHYMNDELQYRYYRDNLTQLYNREGFKIEVQKFLDANPDKIYVIGLASINQLSTINDLCGFDVGDKIIIKGGELAAEFVGKGGVVARYSGTKFLLFFEFDEKHKRGMGTIQTHEFAELGVAFPVSYKTGLYLVKDRTKSVDQMINYAILTNDKIVDTAESSILVYDEELEDRIAKEVVVTSEMHRALEAHEFVSFYQPQYNHVTGKLVGAETLCRWIKPDGSMISPGIFIPIFEKNGFIYNLDKYMWETAFKTIREWLDMDVIPVPISVNISRISINRADFVEVIENLRMRYMIPPEYLHFEVTESAYSSSQSTIINRVNAIRMMGFKVAMDDFGSGYSSLNTLKDVPIDILKLDMGFLRGQNEERGRMIIDNVTQMAKNLNLEMISEGVETKEQADFISGLGCETIQGYFYAKPMPRGEFELRLAPDVFGQQDFLIN